MWKGWKDLPSVTGYKRATLKTELKIATKEFMPRTDGQLGRGFPRRVVSKITIAVSVSNASTTLAISGVQVYAGKHSLSRRFFFFSGFWTGDSSWLGIGPLIKLGVGTGLRGIALIDTLDEGEGDGPSMDKGRTELSKSGWCIFQLICFGLVAATL